MRVPFRSWINMSLKGPGVKSTQYLMKFLKKGMPNKNASNRYTKLVELCTICQKFGTTVNFLVICFLAVGRSLNVRGLNKREFLNCARCKLSIEMIPLICSRSTASTVFVAGLEFNCNCSFVKKERVPLKTSS